MEPYAGRYPSKNIKLLTVIVPFVGKKDFCTWFCRRSVLSCCKAKLCWLPILSIRGQLNTYFVESVASILSIDPGLIPPILMWMFTAWMKTYSTGLPLSLSMVKIGSKILIVFVKDHCQTTPQLLWWSKWQLHFHYYLSSQISTNLIAELAAQVDREQCRKLLLYGFPDRIARMSRHKSPPNPPVYFSIIVVTAICRSIIEKSSIR